MKICLSITAVAAALCSHSAAMAGSLDVGGYWWTPDRASVVEITDCGDGTPCGVVRYVDRRAGGMTQDRHNADGALQGRSMLGIVLLDGFDKGDEAWQGGRIYNPKDGRFYRARIELLSKDELAVSGCLGPICKKLLWTRASDLPLARQGEGSEDQASL
ncbi:MAG: DUF2147 domain-containing protein [Parvularcula sp.]|nr:DUF2147 domain-containing protein [Parvularcula sp.]